MTRVARWHPGMCPLAWAHSYPVPQLPHPRAFELLALPDGDVQPQADLSTAACEATETTEGLPPTSDQRHEEEAGKASGLQAEASHTNSSAGVEGAEGLEDEVAQQGPDGAEVSACLEGQSESCNVLERTLWQGAQLAGCNSLFAFLQQPQLQQCVARLHAVAVLCGTLRSDIMSNYLLFTLAVRCLL